MDKRLELTPKQIKLVEEFQAILDEMRKENVGVIANYNEDGYGLIDFRLYNSSFVEEVGYNDDFEIYLDDPDYTIYSPDLEELKELPFPNYTEDQQYVDPDANDLPDDYNDDNRHLVVMLKD